MPGGPRGASAAYRTPEGTWVVCVWSPRQRKRLGTLCPAVARQPSAVTSLGLATDLFLPSPASAAVPPPESDIGPVPPPALALPRPGAFETGRGLLPSSLSATSGIWSSLVGDGVRLVSTVFRLPLAFKWPESPIPAQRTASGHSPRMRPVRDGRRFGSVRFPASFALGLPPARGDS